uniref:Ycf1 n=1 Tax=Keteleeria hainanensis TaxID=418983 RepID=UPI0030FE9D4D
MIRVLGLLWDPLSSWIEVSGPIILFGLYYGFITTLPFGPSKIYSIRSFFLGEPIYGIIAISGSITGQLIVFLSMYYSPIYAALWKPHAITLLVVPYMFFRFYQISKEPSSSESLHPINSINNPKILSIFMGGLILQLFNPILLANPVLTRLVNLFLFRYGDNISFVISSFCGWLGGHILFIIFTKFVSFRIERNSPIDYTILRRYINRTFSVFLLSYCLLYLGRAPSPFLKKRNNNYDYIGDKNDHSVAVARDDRPVAIDPKKLPGLPKEEQITWLAWFKQPWPIIFFDHNRAYRPIRYIGNSPFTQLGPVRTEVSQYFFGTYSSDGKQRISFTFLPSVLVLGEKLEKYRDLSGTSCSSEDPYHRWIHTMKRRRDSLGNEFSDRVKALSNGSPVENVMERRVKFSNSQGYSFTEMYDPFLNGAFRGTINQFESSRMLNDSIISNLSDFTEVFMKDRKEGFPNDPFGHRYHISHHWQELEHESFRLPWEPLPTDTVRSLIPITKSSERGKVEPISKRLYLLAERIIPNQARKIFEKYLSNIDSSNIDYSFGNLIYPKDLLKMPSDQIQEIYAKEDDSLIHLLWLEIALRVAYIDIVPEIASCNKRIYTNYLVNIYSRIDGRNVAPTGTIKWELILDLFTTEQKVTSEHIFFFESLAQHEWTILQKFRGNVSTDDSTQTKDLLTLYREILLNEPLEIREIRKHVPRWSSGLMMGDYDELSAAQLTTSKVRSRKIRSTLTFDLEQRQIVLKRFFGESDYRRNVIAGSIRAQRRKITIWKKIQPNVHSPFFLIRMEIPAYPKDYYDTFDSDRVNMEQIQKEIREKIQISKKSEPVPHSMTIVESLCALWAELNHLRGLLLLAQSILRKRIILPSLIIAKNIGRILLFQVPEFSEDWEEMRREVHIKCAPDGTEFSETEFPDKWKKNGMQIKLLFPFRLRPWHRRSKPRFEKRLRWSYLTTFGLETDVPYGDPNPQLGPFSKFFQPIFKKLIFKKLKRGLIIFKKLKRGLRREFIIFKKLKRRLMGSTGIGRIPRVRYIDKSELNDRIQNKLLSETTPMGSANDSPEVNDQFGYGTRTINVKDPDYRTTTMKERIESIAIINSSSPITGMSLVDSEINTGSKGSFNMLGSTFKKRLVQIRRIPGRFRNKSVQLIRKRFYSMKLMKLFIKMDRDLLPSVIHFIGSNIKFWIRSAWIRSTGNIATIYGRIFILNNDISRINRGKITNYYSITEKIQDFEIRPDQNMFSMSQAYVFHKIWQIKTMNRSYSKYLLESRAQASYPLIKKKIKELLDIQRILDHDKPQDLKENDWKQWLRCSDRYNLSPQIWSRINPQKWRNRVSKQCTCYEERFIPYEQQKDSIFAAVMEPSLRLLRKMNKRYRYDLLSYSYLDSTKDSDIHGPPVQPDIPNDKNITDHEGILREKWIRDILEEDWKGTDFNIVNGPRSTIDIYDAIRSCTYDHTTMIDRQKTYFITNRQGVDETRKENVGIMDSPGIEKRGSGLDLKLWLFPELLGIKNIYETKSKLLPGKSFLQEERDRKKMEEKEQKETTNVLEQGIGARSYVQNKKGKEHNWNDEYDKVEDQQTGEVEDQQTGEVEDQQTGEVEDQQTGEVEDQQTGEVEDQQTGKVEDQQTGKIEGQRTNRVIFQYRPVEAIGEESVFKLSDICRVMSGIKDPDQYLWTNIQEGKVNLNLMFLLLDKDRNEDEIWENNLIQGDVPIKVSSKKEIWVDKKIVVPEPYRLSSIPDYEFLMYKIVSISLKFQNGDREWMDGNLYDGSVQRGQILGDEKNILSSLNLEDILLPKRRREFRILNRFDPENDHAGFSNGKDIDIQNDEELMERNQHLSADTTQIIKRFLWPSYRLEDLICMNRYWFNTNDGSRSAMLRIRMYPLTFN